MPGLAKVAASTSRDQQARAKGQEGPEWLKCSLKMAPMGWDGKHKGVKHGIQWPPQTQNGPKGYENKDVKHKFQDTNIIVLQ